MNRAEQAICRIREKVPDNKGFKTLGVGCVVKNEELAASLGWKCPNLIVTSSAVLTPEHLALDRIILAEFLVFEKKGFEVFDLKLASEFCRTVSSRAVNDEEVSRRLPNNRVTVISVEPLDKRGFLKRMVKKSSLQTSRPIDCFEFQDFQNELTAEGIFCNVIREFGPSAQEFETRTYKFKYNLEKHKYFLEDFGDQYIELGLPSFPDDQNPNGGVIFSKLGAYVGCLGYEVSGILPCFIPTSNFQGAESTEETKSEEEKEENKLLAEGTAPLVNENKENELATDENKNEDSEVASVSVQSVEELHEDVKDKTEKEEVKNDVGVEQQTDEQNKPVEAGDEVPEEAEIEVDKESDKNSQINDNEKGDPSGEDSPENLETLEVPEEETSEKEENNEEETSEKEENNDAELSEHADQNIELNADEKSSDLENVISVENSEIESKEDVENIESGNGEKQDETVGEISEQEEKSEEEIVESVPQDDNTGSLDNKDDEKISDEVLEQTLQQETDNELVASVEDKDVSDLGDVTMETNQVAKEFPPESTKIEDKLEPTKKEDKLEPSVSLHTETEVKNSDEEILEPLSNSDEVTEERGAGHSHEIGTESSIETDQVNSANQVAGADEGKVSENTSVMEDDSSVPTSEVKTEKNPHEEATCVENPVPTLEEELDMQLSGKTREVKSEEVPDEGEKDENIKVQVQEKEDTLDTDENIISSETNPENDGNLEEKSTEISKSGKTDRPDGPAVNEEVLKLEPTQSPRREENDVGESLEPDALLSSTITNNPKILDDLAILLDTEYQHGGVASWHDMALLLDIPKEAYDHCLSYSKSSPTEGLMMFLSNTNPQFTINDLKDSLRSIGRTDVVHILDRYIARSIISDESVIVGVVERDDTDLLGELALKLDRGSGQNWKSLALHLEVPRRIFKHFGAHQRQNSALLMLKYLPIFDPDLTVQSLKDACEAISKFDVVKFLDASGVPGDDAIMDILEDTDIIDEITDMLNDDEVVPNWKDLAKELKIPQEKFSIFEPSAKKSPTKLLLQSIEQCEPDITVEELILALVAMKRHDVIDMLYKHFKRSDIRSILEDNNCLPPEPEVPSEEKADDDAESFA